jgi:hypothetical protein
MMPECPRCHQPIDAQAIACPHCHVALKAYGHPGITLFRATDDTYLCDTCTYQADDTCTFPQRPHAKECTLYTNLNQQPAIQPSQTSLNLRRWTRGGTVWWLIAGLLAASVWLAWSNQPTPRSCQGDSSQC